MEGDERFRVYSIDGKTWPTTYDLTVGTHFMEGDERFRVYSIDCETWPISSKEFSKHA